MNMEEMTVMKRKKQNMEKALSGRVLGVVSALDLAAIVVPLCVGLLWGYLLIPLCVTGVYFVFYFGWTLYVLELFSRKQWQNRVLLAVNLLNLLILILLAVLGIAFWYGIGMSM